MPSAFDFMAVTGVLASWYPPEADIVGVEISADRSYVTIWTTTPRAIIGPGGQLAETVRRSLEIQLDTTLTFRVERAESDNGEHVSDTDLEGVNPVWPVGISAEAVPKPRIPRLRA